MKTLEPTTKVQTTTQTTTMMKRKRKQMTQDEHRKSDRKHQTHANRQGRPDDRLILNPHSNRERPDSPARLGDGSILIFATAVTGPTSSDSVFAASRNFNTTWTTTDELMTIHR